MSFDPNSTDSMFATVLARLEAQDKVLQEIKQAVHLTNGRVRALETWKQIITAKVATISAGISALVAAAAWAWDQFCH